MAQRIRKDDLVKVIAGKNKGTTRQGSICFTNKRAMALVEGVGLGHRHVKPSQINPRGGKKDLHVGISLHKLALVVDEKTSKTSRVGYKVTDGVKARVARQQRR